MHQDVNLYAALLDAGQSAKVTVAPGRRAWVQVARGSVVADGQVLGEGDGAAVEAQAAVTIEGRDAAEVLVFDLA